MMTVYSLVRSLCDFYHGTMWLLFQMYRLDFYAHTVTI